MTTNTETRVAVDSSIAAKLLEWVNAGRGVRRWVSAEIGNPRPDMFTPGDIDTPPHWAYPVADSQLLTGEEIDVETFTPRSSFKGRGKNSWRGYSIHPNSAAKAQRLCLEGETFNWERNCDSYSGGVIVSIGRMVTTPLIS